MSETAMSEEAMREADMSGDCPHLWPSRWARGAACAVGRARSLGANARLVGEDVHVASRFPEEGAIRANSSPRNVRSCASVRELGNATASWLPT